MLLIEGNKIKKQYGDRTLFYIEDIKVYSNDKVGVVGLNGSGKTTLIDILSGEKNCDEGYVKRYGKYSYIHQLDKLSDIKTDGKLIKKFDIKDIEKSTMSGGEKTRLKIAQSFSGNSQILFADEPTCNLDIKGIKLLEEKLLDFDGAIVVISHDRELLDKVCNKIIEIDDGKVYEYIGNYSDYKKQKEMNLARQKEEYEQYSKEKKRLTEAILEKSQKSTSMRKVPKRFGNAEARLHKRSVGTKKAKLEKSAKAIQSRIDQLEVKHKPKEYDKVKITLNDNQKLHTKILISGEDVNKSFKNKKIFNEAAFNIYNETKTAIIGDNGTGKTTLINMILSNDRIKTSRSLKIGYVSQSLNELELNKSILENVMENSIYKEEFVRIILGRLHFKREDVYKNIKILSGGERVKVAFAKTFLSDINILILDEPTNYLDIDSQEALEEVLNEYDGTLLFVSHDRRFIDKIATNLLIIDNYKIVDFQGNYSDYIKRSEIKEKNEDLMVLENKLTEIIGKLSVPDNNVDKENLNEEYHIILNKIRKIKANI